MAQKYCIKNENGELKSNGGQIAKEYLLHREKEGFSFTCHNKEIKTNIRRGKKRILGHGVAMPCEPSPKYLRKELSAEIFNKNISLGHAINIQTYVKIKIIDNKPEKVEFTVEGRKHTMLELREKLLKKHEKYMRLNSDDYFDNLTQAEVQTKLSMLDESMNSENNLNGMRKYLKKLERSRNIQVWHDASTIANHSHILFSLNVLYDKAVFLTDNEYFEMTGEHVSVQSIIESPELYIIGRCRSNDEQMGYIETRNEDLLELNKEITLNDINIHDTMRMFHGDGPAVQLESGHQKGGHYFCPTCDIFLYRSDELSYSYSLPVNTFTEKQQHVLKGKFGKINSKKSMLKPFKSLNAAQLKEELTSRNIHTEKSTKDDLTKLLKKELKGCTRVPILLHHDPIDGITNFNLREYEIAMVEPMHDIGGHITNIIEELPRHLSKDDQELFNNIVTVSYNHKDTHRNCDKRKLLLTLIINLDGNINNKVVHLLKTLSEIQRILYLKEDHRTCKEILRLHNSCYQHLVLMKEVIGFKTKLTREKLYGKYMHNLLIHSPTQLRIINGQSLNCEGEERFFNTIKSITNQTTSYHPGHIIGNCIVRHQIEQRTKDANQRLHYETPIQNEINKLSSLVTKRQYDTLVTYDHIKKHPGDWQAHLERIPDFLLAGEDFWWKKTEFGIEFNDHSLLTVAPSIPQLRHFRSTNIKTNEHQLKKDWEKIITTDTIIPASIIIFENGDSTNRVPKNYLAPYLPLSEEKERKDEYYQQYYQHITTPPVYDVGGGDGDDKQGDLEDDENHSYFQKEVHQNCRF